MPLNEARRPYRSTLTAQQRRDAELAIYGAPPETPMPPSTHTPTQLTRAELEQMRIILAQHESAHVPMKEFDLNKPKLEPYAHQEFPKLLYHRTRGNKKAESAEHQAQLEADGYQTKPAAAAEPEPAAVELTSEELAEIEALDKLARKKKTR
jgi:hypothetical protein